jgi:molecular chaperone GrpE (heat shock protein)
MRRVEREQADQKINAQIDNLKKFLPLFDQIQKIVDALSDADRETPLAK